jgi:hypothetical protein
MGRELGRRFLKGCSEPKLTMLAIPYHKVDILWVESWVDTV